MIEYRDIFLKERKAFLPILKSLLKIDQYYLSTILIVAYWTDPMKNLLSRLYIIKIIFWWVIYNKKYKLMIMRIFFDLSMEEKRLWFLIFFVLIII